MKKNNEKRCRNCQNAMLTDNTYYCPIHNKSVRANESCTMFIDIGD